MEIISDNHQFTIAPVCLIVAYTSNVKVFVVIFSLLFPPCSLVSENYCMIVVVNDIVPGLSTLVKLSVPDQRSNKVRIFSSFYMTSLFFLSYAYICND